MMESSIALMQMSRTALAVNELKRKNIPFVVVLTDPTTGGVTASFGMLGDLIIAEPKALIGLWQPHAHLYFGYVHLVWPYIIASCLLQLG